MIYEILKQFFILMCTKWVKYSSISKFLPTGFSFIRPCKAIFFRKCISLYYTIWQIKLEITLLRLQKQKVKQYFNMPNISCLVLLNISTSFTYFKSSLENGFYHNCSWLIKHKILNFKKKSFLNDLKNDIQDNLQYKYFFYLFIPLTTFIDSFFIQLPYLMDKNQLWTQYFLPFNWRNFLFKVCKQEKLSIKFDTLLLIQKIFIKQRFWVTTFLLSSSFFLTFFFSCCLPYY